MLPFASIDFFVFLTGTIILMGGFRFLLRRWIPFPAAILILSLIYLLFFYPKPVHVLILAGWAYLITTLFISVFRIRNKVPGILLLLIPLLLVKSTIRFDTYPFALNDVISFAGLSYISFRIISLYMDLEPGAKPVNGFRYLSYLIFTPTILIGPIDRYHHFSKDLDGGYSQVNAAGLKQGLDWMVYGLLYKFVIAEVISRYWLDRFSPESRAWLDMLMNMYGYYLYLFFDFAGYSYMAMGAGKMLGMAVPVNFHFPFLARNPQDFWRRFHITLGDWLKDYFFTPLYTFFTRQKRLKAYPLLRQNVALFLTFLLMGCWNGFSGNFILSGALFGLYSMVHNSYVYYCRRRQRDLFFGNLPERYVKLFSIIIMFNLAAFAIYIFSGRCPWL